jgi:hypothetical protein
VKRVTAVALGSVLVALVALSAAAGDKRPCADDVEKFCKDVKPGGGRIVKCLEAHQSDLSDACKKRLESGGARMKAVQAACGADVEKWCKDVKPGGGRIVKCLKEHQTELSAECKTHVEK